MPLTTIDVTVIVNDDGGDPVENANVVAKLNRAEVYEGFVVPRFVTGVTDAAGTVVMSMWPNELGATESMYEFSITNPDTKFTEQLLATIPNANCNLHEVANLPAYPGKNDGELAVDNAVAAASQAQTAETNAGNSATAASGSATAAGTSETNAGNSATAASGSASAASTSETNAGNSASAAATSETNSASSATASENSKTYAQEWANKAEDALVSVAAGADGIDDYSAMHWAKKAQTYAAGVLTYKGSWDASGGSYPGTPVTGNFYKISVAGTMGGTPYAVGDSIIYNGSDWDKIDNTEQVTSVAGRTGAIVISWSDVESKPTTLAGYGITDAALASHTHTFGSLTSKPTTIAGYGITDAVKAGDSVTLTGDVTGTADFDANGDVSITATVGNDSHTHATQYLGLTAQADDSAEWDGATKTVSLSDPSGGNDGDIWLTYE